MHNLEALHFLCDFQTKRAQPITNELISEEREPEGDTKHRTASYDNELTTQKTE